MMDATNTRVCHGRSEEEDAAYWEARSAELEGWMSVDPERFERVRRYAAALQRCEEERAYG